MVIVKLQGGIGNQLFQFAFGRAIALYRNDNLFFDLSFLSADYRNITIRSFKLEYLTNFRVLDLHDIYYFNSLVNSDEAITITDGFPKDQLFEVFNDKRIVAMYLDGYFQNDFYFLSYANDIKVEIRNMLNYHLCITSFNGNKLISGDPSTVGVHLRRTDYLKPSVLAIHGICEDIYYKHAINLLLAKLTEPKFYLFSDENLLADELFLSLKNKKNVSAILTKTTFVNKDLIELALMCKCSNFIIANSSYSWWGSYLSENPDKIVIAPKNWYRHPDYSQQSEDIALQSWIRI